jgi:hypothetical protein
MTSAGSITKRCRIGANRNNRIATKGCGMTTEKPMDVDVLFQSRPELFTHPIRSLEMRRTVFVGEKVKILTGIREREQLIAGRWLVVESIAHTESGLQCFGRSWWHADDSDLSFTFGPESICRMEPRRFFIWGSRGVPVATRGGDGPDGRTPARPLDAQENFVEECDGVILEFTAMGVAAAEAHYREMASSNANWPPFDDLK